MALRTPSPYGYLKFNQIYKGDARLLAQRLPDQSIAVTLTSPPYWGFAYWNLGNEKCSDLVDGHIYINSNHYLNKIVFGADQESYNQKIEKDSTAQYRLSALVVEQSVYRLAEDSYIRNRLVLNDLAPVTSLREFIDQKTHPLAPKIVKALMTK